MGGTRSGRIRLATAAMAVVALATAVHPAQAAAQTGPTGAIAGTISRTAGGAAQNVCIDAYGGAIGETASTGTQMNGSYSLTDLTPGTWHVDIRYCVKPRDFSSQHTFARATVNVVSGQTATLNRSIGDPSSVVGHITSAQTGEPVPGVCVSVESFYGTSTDATGHYAISGLNSSAVPVSQVIINGPSYEGGCRWSAGTGFGRSYAPASGQIGSTPLFSGATSTHDTTVVRPAAGDLDGDGRTDHAVFRPSNGRWYVNGVPGSTAFGTTGDVPIPINVGSGVPGLRDLRAELAVFRPSNGRWYTKGFFGSAQFGALGDVALPGDWDGDSGIDLAVFRPSTGRWYIEVGGWAPEEDPIRTVAFGTLNDIPVPADYNGNGVTEVAVFRPSNGRWYVEGVPGSLQFGTNGDIPVPADYDGDGDTDFAVFRPGTGRWYISGTPGSVQFGANGDIPVPGDYDGDATDDIAVFRPSNGRWYVEGIAGSVQFGTNGDIPIPRATRP